MHPIYNNSSKRLLVRRLGLERMGQKVRSESVSNFFMNMILYLYNAGTFFISFQASEISVVSDPMHSQDNIFHVQCFSFFQPPPPPSQPLSSLLVHGLITQSPAPGPDKNFNQSKFPLLKSIYIGHVNGLWVLIAS